MEKKELNDLLKLPQEDKGVLNLEPLNSHPLPHAHGQSISCLSEWEGQKK